MKDVIRQAFQDIMNIHGEVVFNNPTQFKHGLGDALGNRGVMASEARRIRNLLNIAIVDMRSYSRLKSALNKNEFYVISNLVSEMDSDYNVKTESAQIVMECIAELLGDISLNSAVLSERIIETIKYHGGTYVGEVKYGKPHGKGTTIYANGYRYVGGWKDGEYHGQGTETDVNGGAYIGEWEDGERDGQGTLLAGGYKYVGGWKNGKHSGQGTETFANGNEYVGEWEDGEHHGQGTFIWASGAKYVGEWKDGERHGQGTCTYSNGDEYVGEWKNDVFCGQSSSINKKVKYEFQMAAGSEPQIGAGNIVNFGYVAQQNDWIFYCNFNDGEKLYKMRLDGSDRTKLNEDKSFYINVADDWIFYCNYSDGKKLYKIRTDGSDRTKLSEDSVSSINIANGWIFYISGSEIDIFLRGRERFNDPTLYKTRMDGTQRQIVI